MIPAAILLILAAFFAFGIYLALHCLHELRGKEEWLDERESALFGLKLCSGLLMICGLFLWMLLI